MPHPVYSLTLHRTYYNKGFFNIGVEADRYVRPDDGPCSLRLGDSGERLEARVDRKANLNKTPRIHAGVKLRDWFFRHFDEMDDVDVIIEAPNALRLRKPNT